MHVDIHTPLLDAAMNPPDSLWLAAPRLACTATRSDLYCATVTVV